MGPYFKSMFDEGCPRVGRDLKSLGRLWRSATSTDFLLMKNGR